MTGGVGTPTTVSKYSQTGWVEDLPSLKTGRYRHGCGTYLDSNNQMVSCEKNIDNNDINTFIILEIPSDRWTEW